MSDHAKAKSGSTSTHCCDAQPPGKEVSPTAPRDDLVDRVRAVLSGRDVREVSMFGGVSFMVEQRMAVAAGHEGDLLVRIDADHHDELLRIPGAQVAVMGTDRPMGQGWISVRRSHLDTRDDLDFWIRTALEFHATQLKKT